jgi:hypothetical protein
MKKQFFLLGAAAIFGFAACNDSATDSTTTTDSSATTNTMTTTTGPTRGTEIANFSTRTFMDVKTNKPVKLRWDTERYYYVDESGSQPYYYYDPSTKDTFDYWGRRLNDYLIYENNDYRVDESRMPAMDMSPMDTSSPAMSGDMKVKATDDKYKEKTDTSKLKVTDDKIKAKKK